MKKILFTTALILSIACSRKAPSEGVGTLALSIEPDAAITQLTKSDVSQYGTVPTASDFKLTIKNYASETAWEGKFTDFDPSTKFTIGEYTASVVSGNSEEEGPGKPCFSAKETYQIANLETTPVTLKPSLANCIVKVAAGNYVKKYFSSWKFTLTTGAGAVFEPSESDALFIDAYKFDLKGSFTTSGGKTVEFSKTFASLAPATLYNVVVDVDNLAAGSFTITFNDQVETITIEEELS